MAKTKFHPIENIVYCIGCVVTFGVLWLIKLSIQKAILDSKE